LSPFDLGRKSDGSGEHRGWFEHESRNHLTRILFVQPGFVREAGSRAADGPALIPIDKLRGWFDEQEWENATFNRYRTTLSLIYHLGMETGKVQANPAKLLKHKREDSGRVRFLNQFAPAETKVEYLKPHADEESRLRAVILSRYPEHMPEFEIALHTGVRPSEQYGLDWSRVDLVRSFLSLPTTKNEEARHIPLNAVAAAALKTLQKRSLNGEGSVFVNID